MLDQIDRRRQSAAGPAGGALRQARRCERRAHSPRAAERVGSQPACPTGEGAQDAGGHPERVQQRAVWRQEGLARRPNRSGRLRRGRAGGEECRSRRDGFLRAGTHGCLAGANRCGLLRRPRTGRGWLPKSIANASPLRRRGRPGLGPPPPDIIAVRRRRLLRMKCPRCQAENREGARFCRGCGATFGAVCSSCGAKVEAASKFCDGCGAPLAATPVPGLGPSRFASPESYTPRHLVEKILTSKTALEGERKQVTVLFAGSIANSSPLRRRGRPGLGPLPLT
jgi:hypothetical protein